MQIEGKNQVWQALNSGLTINKIMIDVNYSKRKDDIVALARKNKVRVDFVPKQALDRKSTTLHHQGYIADAVEFEYTPLEKLLASAGENPFLCCLMELKTHTISAQLSALANALALTES